MITMEFKDLWKMVEDISAHTLKTGDTILNADSPPYFNFASVPYQEGPDSEEMLWSISLNDVFKCLDAEPDSLRSFTFKECLKSREGRNKLAMSFPGQKYKDYKNQQEDLKPTEPTSGSWSGDAEALLNMGASMVDSTTVEGLLSELKSSRTDPFLAGLERVMGEINAWARQQHEVAMEKAEDTPCSAEEYVYEAEKIESLVNRLEGVLSQIRKEMGSR